MAKQNHVPLAMMNTGEPSEMSPSKGITSAGFWPPILEVTQPLETKEPLEIRQPSSETVI
ncbi:hypothetical protein M3181_08245 [Mesobacillus maritimus]|uniref:hypothetical protein n=1 Tax=Mesobacillus maritimus TaxID=1643336 RepID=UPI00203DADED|nr:hypothetical protein [Mesobacillus maritimus]MCM3668990.1 hypothetical protein [Mesobacillus maritimus]